jgi:hypothetical protein
MRKGLLALLAGVLATGLITAGCGGDDDDGNGGSDSATALSKPDYVRQANKICKDADAALSNELQDRYPNGAPSEQADVEEAVSEVIVPNFEGQLEDLRALPAPKGDEDTVAAIYDELESAIGKAKEDPGSLTTGDPFLKATGLAHDYGLSECGPG